jgi:hypothetical protein
VRIRPKHARIGRYDLTRQVLGLCESLEPDQADAHGRTVYTDSQIGRPGSAVTQGGPTPVAPLMRAESAALQKAVSGIAAAQAEFGDHLDRGDLKKDPGFINGWNDRGQPCG